MERMSCGAEEMAGDTAELTFPHERATPPEWLAHTREQLARAGDYLAFDDGDEIRTVAIGDGWTRVGRSLSADVRIGDPTVSRRHALIHRDGENVRVLDDRSLNGVFRNGQRVELEELEDGDTLSIGRFDVHFLRLANDRHHAFA
jgi:pSer/pThr/pTyr-binding forkhead associated (FHA) protein